MGMKPGAQTTGEEIKANCRQILSKFREYIQNPTEIEAKQQAAGGFALSLSAFGGQAPMIKTTITYWSTVALQSAGVNGLGQTLCQYGAGDLVSLVLWLGGLILLGKAILAWYQGLSAGNSRQARGKVDQRSHNREAGKLVMGAFALGITPALLRGIGFSLLPCIKAVPIYHAAGTIVPVVAAFL